MERSNVTKATLGRLPQYLQFLNGLPPGQYDHISATTIARMLSLGEVQVRKDLAAVSGLGKPKVGYRTSELIKDLEDALGCKKLTPAILVGAGKLGRALLDYNGFEEYGVQITAAFDCNEQVLRMNNTSKEILPISSLKKYCSENGIRIGIITVGSGSAQDVCDQMLEAGITAIWNFAPCQLKVPDNVLVKQENLALSLAHLNSQISK
ncbi:MAG: redox-sensing transcriptional repressor Rex [Clostridia bacterium]|nr:redox-sensing transcriptional repressor Rex [Clostridia bacterium]